MKYDILKQLKENGLIAVIRGKTPVDAFNISKHVILGGLNSIELTFTTPFAQQAISQLSMAYANDKNVVIGAGTVLDDITARIAILNGAKFIVSPSFDKEVAKICNLYSIPYFPGCVSPTEIVEAMKYGCEIIKLFPGGLLTPGYIKDIHGPLPNVEFIPSGGVDMNNIGDWVSKGAWAISAGSSLTKDLKLKGYDSVTTNTKEFVQKYKLAINK